MKGNWGRILTVDLSTGTTGVEELPEKTYRDFLGGSGLAAKWFFDREGWKVDPLGPDNPLMIMLGPVSGSGLIGTSRLEICARSPLTGIWGEACMGGHFAPQLRGTGYDGMIITGASDKPVYLFVTDKEVEIRDASDYWGKDTYETEDKLLDDIGDKRAQVMCIGPAGENLVKYANVMNDKGSTAGRCGMGAVMGSKKLKAVVCRGKKKMEIADPEAFKQDRKEAAEKVKFDLVADGLRAFGTNVHMEYGMAMGDVPTRNWTVAYWPDGPEKLGGTTIAETILTKGKSCYGCAVGCKRITAVDSGPFAAKEGPGAEYEGVVALGCLNLINDAEANNKANEMCNRYGMDVISSGSTIAYATEAYEKGLITDKDTGGIKLGWGQPRTQLQLLDQIAHREGFGNELAEGSKVMSEKFGGKEFAIHVKGLECPMHDPRALWGMALTYATSIRGACHCADTNLYTDMGVQNHSDIGIKRSWPYKVKGKAEVTVGSQVKGVISNSAVICSYAWGVIGEMDELVTAINHITGMGYTKQELVDVGHRIWYIKRAIGNLCGMTREDDRLPERILKPHEEGATANMIPLLFPTFISMGPMGKFHNEKIMPYVHKVLNTLLFPNMNKMLRAMTYLPPWRGGAKKLLAQDTEEIRRRTVPFDEMLNEYYVLRDIDEMGRPSRQRLASLGMADVANALFQGEAITAKGPAVQIGRLEGSTG